MEAGFNENPFSYLFTLRLVPIFPFAVVNIAPALLGAKFRDYFITTLIGMIPGTIAYSWVGYSVKNTLSKAAETGESVNAIALLKTGVGEMIPALFALAAVATIPLIYKKFFKKNSAVAGA